MSLDNGIVLPGVTRESIIQLLEDHAAGTKAFPLEGMPTKIRVVERDISMRELRDGAKDGSLKGMFGCGTGVVVVSVGEIQYQGEPIFIPSNPLIKLLRDAVTGIQRGRIPSEWSYQIPDWDGQQAEDKVNGDDQVA